jgi:hypothetical protein
MLPDNYHSSEFRVLVLPAMTKSKWRKATRLGSSSSHSLPASLPPTASSLASQKPPPPRHPAGCWWVYGAGLPSPCGRQKKAGRGRQGAARLFCCFVIISWAVTPPSSSPPLLSGLLAARRTRNCVLRRRVESAAGPGGWVIASSSSAVGLWVRSPQKP